MGVGHLNIGENLGGAQLYGPNPAVQEFSNLLAQRKAKQDADNKYLADQLSSVKPDGLRNDADRTNFYNKYSAIRQQGMDAENETDPLKKAMAFANVKQGMMELGEYVNQSKQQAARENQFAQQYMSNPTAYSDDAIAQHRKGIVSAADSPDAIKDYTTLARQPDLVKLDTRLNKLIDDQLVGVKGEDVITGSQMVGNKRVNQIQTKYTADPTDVSHAFLNEYDINPDFQHLLQHKYADQIQPGSNPMQTKAALVGAYTKDLGDVYKYDKVKEIPDDTSFANHIRNRQYDIAHPLPSQAQSNQLTPLQGYASSMMNGDAGAGNQFVGLIPKNKFKPGEQATFEINNGQHVITIPEQVEPDKKALAANEALKLRYQQNPQTTGGILGFGGDPVPFEQSDIYKNKFNKNPYIHKGDAQTYTLPADPVGYQATLAQIAAKNGIAGSQINQMVGGKGGHGLNSSVQKRIGSSSRQKNDPLGLFN